MRAIRTLIVPLAGFVLLAQSAENLLDQGIEQFHKGEYVDARNSFTRAVSLSPADARAITFLAITKAALGDCSHSIDELRLQAGRNSDLEIRRLAGLAYIQCLIPQNRFNDIMPVLQQLQRTFPEDPDILYESAKVYNRAWNFTISDLYQKAPSSFRVNQLSAEIFESQGKYSEAISEYEKAVQKNPAALNLHYRLGRAMLLASHDPAQLDKAREQFEAELKLNPADAAAQYQIGQIYQNQQKTEDAAEHFGKALEIAPHFAEALVALGKIRTQSKQNDDAIALLERAVRLQPAMESAHYNLMLAYRAAGKNKEAQREKKELDKLQRPPDGEFSEFLKKLGDKQEQKNQ
ncbi:MAG: tetratricopeptide repeat protein [Acidobacteriaceae bacterium]|nr:tetratricopeptide repeat protein [Acidobacteriaceae bacterium]